MWAAMKRLAWVLLSVSCGARTDLGGSHAGDAGPSGSCSAPAAKPCTAWHASTGQSIATGNSGAATASGCGVLAAWSVQEGNSIVWSTQYVGFDGVVLGPP